MSKLGLQCTQNFADFCMQIKKIMSLHGANLDYFSGRGAYPSHLQVAQNAVYYFFQLPPQYVYQVFMISDQ
jgi:hypothetical protein